MLLLEKYLLDIKLLRNLWKITDEMVLLCPYIPIPTDYLAL